jgi:hypothetical protein
MAAKLRAAEYRIYELDPWEEGRAGIAYAEKDI